MSTKLLTFIVALTCSLPLWAQTDASLPPREQSPAPEEILPPTTPPEAAKPDLTPAELATPKTTPMPTENTKKEKSESSKQECPPCKQTKPLPPQELLTPTDFQELSFSIRPGIGLVTANPTNWTDPAFNVTGAVSYFIHPRVAINVPYTFTPYGSSTLTHAIGGGPLYRFLDRDYLRASVEANGLYVRVPGQNKVGWSAGCDFTYGFPKAPLRPFFGPFVRYDYVYLTGRDLQVLTLGVGLTLTQLTDLD